MEHIDQKEKVKSYISSPGYRPLKFDRLAEALDVPKDEKDSLKVILNELMDENFIYMSRRLHYCAIDTSAETKIGTVVCTPKSNISFVCCDDPETPDIHIRRSALGRAFCGDMVVVAIVDGKGEGRHPEGYIIKVLERANWVTVGIVDRKKDGFYRVKSEDPAFFSKVRIAEEDLGGAEIGSRVLVKINYYSDEGKPFGEVTSILGDEEDIRTAVETCLVRNKVSLDFDSEVMEEANAAAEYVSETEISGREDLRERIVFTIDGDDSRDFDDAVSLETLENGNRLLGVHIADVSHYVKEGTALDDEALRRSMSIYLPNAVLPMLPEKLSNGICSLNPGVDRLTMSVFMEIDEHGKIIRSRLCKSVIRSRERMTYDNVNKILADDKPLRERYLHITGVLEDMAALSDLLRRRRDERGALDFDNAETVVLCDGDGNPVELRRREQGAGERMIESFMIAANETIALTAQKAEIPFVYRVHDAPTRKKTEILNEFLKNFALHIDVEENEEIQPKALRSIIDKAQGMPEKAIILSELLRSMMKACYRDTNDGHFGLAAEYYCHFTSPIRRYPDLMIHRILNEYIDRSLTDAKRRHFAEKVREAATVSSRQEIKTQDVEYAVRDIFMAAYMKNHLGESFDAVISAIADFGMFAVLPNSCEGLIHYHSMKGDRFRYAAEKGAVVGMRSAKTFKVGDTIKVTLTACSIRSGKLEFEPDIEIPAPQVPPKKRRSRKQREVLRRRRQRHRRRKKEKKHAK